MTKKKAAVLGAGSWGTVLAAVLEDNGLDVTLWARRKELAAEINRQRTNSRYLPDIHLPEALKAVDSIEEAVAGKDLVLFVVPSHSMRAVAKMAAPHLGEETAVIHAAKGFELGSLKRMSEVLEEELPASNSERIAVLSGPSHAEEVIRKSPTAVVVASNHPSAAEEAQSYLINSYFRVYTHPDVTGVEVGGSLKNIIALGAGLTDGLGFGDNAKAALVTRGLAEMARLGMAMGAKPITFAGLSGVGDLVVTCTSRHSRNWRAGHLLSKGIGLEEVLKRMGMVVEGVKTTQAAIGLAEKNRVEMPIARELYAVLFDGKHPRQAVEDLMARGKTDEMEEMIRGERE
ncbi:glycerol-3-phosphate dehydrogenase (NAD(P)+) [Melghirimyces profundicolus]|uniref:Glycerol-3-phosphate dehydrogenase [NAD(P)+] n=1 Tax=Melghirimyces profundicolus TaxID=1242148 RepID=A0A2T6BUX2_9BACL|nr:NAD(P)H-dependent glycerol-3-phosphate dehydrogenase [Melghirimyces profundicolus]PTX59891.1 glycerol-3-phosphate dehydrogenase (NAD(P)+) [Melghirimyces profundicolus]